MSRPGFRLRHIVFLGPAREPAYMDFGPGLNVIYGASDTGKSFLVEAIDFMLGGKPPLRDIPERVGYDRILLGIETVKGETFTLRRSADGGRFKVYEGLYSTDPGDEVECRELAEQHSDKNKDNLSSFLLEKCELAGRRVRKNKRGVTNSLSFRNLARLVIVTETEITDQRSPLSEGNPTTDTTNFATFKLLLTGVDDSALVSSGPATPEDQTREAQADLLDQLIEDYKTRLKQLTRSPNDLMEQLDKIEASLEQRTSQLQSTEADYRRLTGLRRELRGKLEEARDRQSEIASLLERFSLLEDHYQSDIARLRGIAEAGTLFVALGQKPCPLCGAEPAHHRRDADCDGNVDAIVAAARGETAKINLLQNELKDTNDSLIREYAVFERQVPKLEERLNLVSSQVDEIVSPQLTQMRTTFAELANKRGEIREALAVFRTLEDVQRRRTELEREVVQPQQGATVAEDLPSTVTEKFAMQVEEILKSWHFPGADRVFFDSKSRDLIIAGKARTARGKGLRAITHAAFTIGLLQYCRTQDTPHPGFVVLDSPLLAYRAPEGKEDDLTGTDLNEQFYAYLASLPEDRQVIVVENSDPPSSVLTRPQVVMFSKNPHAGRYGLFPIQNG